MIDIASEVRHLKTLGILFPRWDVLARAKAVTGKTDGRRVTGREKLKATFDLIQERADHETD